jgi:D-alanine-D-alanine ligase
MSGKKRIGVIFGGQSSEHEVSRVSAQSVISNLDKNKYEVVMIGITREGKWLAYEGPIEKLSTGEWQTIAETNRVSIGKPVQTGDFNSAREILRVSGAERKGKKIDIAFPVLHGANGEDGTIQGLFELADIPYVGCGVLGSALGMDKYYAKIVFEKENLPQGKYLAISKKQIMSDLDQVLLQIEEMFTYPCFVKPCNSGSSVGVSKASTRDELVDALNIAIKYDRRILVEEFIDGQEVECAVLGNDEPIASTVGEIIPCNEFYDYEAKYSAESTSEVLIPAKLPSKTIEKIREYAVKAFKALECAGLARADFFVQKKTGKIYINELNTMPGFTQISMYPKLWEASGISYPELLDRLIELAIEKHQEKTDISRGL